MVLSEELSEAARVGADVDFARITAYLNAGGDVNDVVNGDTMLYLNIVYDGISLKLHRARKGALPRRWHSPSLEHRPRAKAGSALAAGGLVDWCSRPGLPRPRVSPRELPREQTLEQPQT